MTSFIIFLTLFLFTFQYNAPYSETTIPAFNENKDSPPFLSFSEELVEAKMGKQSRQIISLKIGIPKQELKVKLSTAICGLWILDKHYFKRGYDYKTSESFQSMDVQGKVDFTRGILVKDYMNFCKVDSFEKIPFLLVNQIVDTDKIPRNYDGLIGFGYKCRSASLGNINIFDYFQGKGNIKNDITVFLLNASTLKGKFTFGGYPNKLDIKSRHYRTVPLNKNNDNGHWEVNLHSIYFSTGDMMLINKPLSIGIGGSAFGVNEEVFDYIVGHYFYDSMEKGLCVLDKEEVWEIFCNKEFDIESIGNIGLILGKWNIKIKPGVMFKDVTVDKEMKKWFSIVFYQELSGQFYLSQTMLEGINAVVYNRENDVLGIYEGDYNEAK